VNSYQLKNDHELAAQLDAFYMLHPKCGESWLDERREHQKSVDVHRDRAELHKRVLDVVRAVGDQSTYSSDRMVSMLRYSVEHGVVTALELAKVIANHGVEVAL
jgi:hypothetical protein